MSIFGWSYPPGAANDPSAPYNQDADDDSCVACGNELPADPAEPVWPFEGFCGLGCALKFKGSHRFLHGDHALEVARSPGCLGGPGFEESIIQPILARCHEGKVEFRLSKTPADQDLLEHRKPGVPYTVADQNRVASFATSWAWRLWAGQQCMAFRLTRRLP